MIIKTEFTAQDVAIKLIANNCEIVGMFYQISVIEYSDYHNIGRKFSRSISQECYDTRVEADQAFALAVAKYS